MSTLEVNTIDSVSGTSNLTIGSSNSSQITLKSGATLTNFPANTPAFSVVKNADQDISTDTDTKVTWETELYDTDSAFASNKFTVPTGEGGKYFLTANVKIEYGNGSGERGEMSVRVNNSTVRQSVMAVSGNAVNPQSVQICCELALSAADYVEIYFLHEKGATQPIKTGTNTFWMMHKLAGA
jgi:hypothetical protein